MVQKEKQRLCFFPVFCGKRVFCDTLIGVARKEIVFCGQINLRDTSKELSLLQGFSEPLIGLCAWRGKSQYNVSKMEHLLFSPGTRVHRGNPVQEMLLVFLTQNTLLCPSPFSNHTSRILKTKWWYSHWPNDLGSQMPKATCQKLLLSFTVTNPTETDESIAIWLNYTYCHLYRYPI